MREGRYTAHALSGIVLLYLCTFPLLALGEAPSPTLRNITVRGNTVLTKADIEQIMQSKVGAAYDRDQIQRDLQAIIRTYRHRGYIHATLVSWMRRSFPDGVYVSFKIDEGRIGKIEVRGNTRTRTRIILQELLLKPNELYNEENRLESERILRKRPHLGDVRIYSRYNPDTRRVDVVVHLTDRWTLFPSASLPKFGGGELHLILALTDTNIAGNGQIGRIRYVRTREMDETRNFFSMLFIEPRLFSSHWEFMGNFTQNVIGDSWEVRLRRPFYSLQTRWASEFRSFDRIGKARWYRDGSVIDEYNRHLSGQTAAITYALGQRYSQFRLSSWYTHRQDQVTPVDTIQIARLEDVEAHLAGGSFQYQKIQFVRDTFVDKMGETEDIKVGGSYEASVGRSLDFLGDMHNEYVGRLQWRIRRQLRQRGYLTAGAELGGSRYPGEWRDVALGGDLRVLLRDFYHQTVALRLQTQVAAHAAGRQQLLLGSQEGLRGYPARAFDGDRFILLNLESRRVFFQHPILVLGAALFADMGYIWRAEDGFRVSDLKRSLGVGLRIGVPRLSGAPVYRLDFAWALDDGASRGFQNAILFSMGHLIQIGGNGE